MISMADSSYGPQGTPPQSGGEAPVAPSAPQQTQYSWKAGASPSSKGRSWLHILAALAIVIVAVAVLTYYFGGRLPHPSTSATTTIQSTVPKTIPGAPNTPVSNFTPGMSVNGIFQRQNIAYSAPGISNLSVESTYSVPNETYGNSTYTYYYAGYGMNFTSVILNSSSIYLNPAYGVPIPAKYAGYSGPVAASITLTEFNNVSDMRSAYKAFFYPTNVSDYVSYSADGKELGISQTVVPGAYTYFYKHGAPLMLNGSTSIDNLTIGSISISRIYGNFSMYQTEFPYGRYIVILQQYGISGSYNESYGNASAEHLFGLLYS